MINQSTILITGIPRSGASLIASLIKLSGVFTGDTSGNNMVENTRIRDIVVKPYLDYLNMDPLAQFPLPDTQQMFIPMNWKQTIETVLFNEGCKDKWMYKDCRSSLIWPVWNHAYPNAKWIIVRRRTGDIIQSCMKTAFMNAFKKDDYLNSLGLKTEDEGWLWMVHQYENKFVEMIQSGLNCKIVWPERMVDGDYSQIYETLEWLGLTYNTDSIFNLIDHKLWKSRQKERSK